jgi:hypothetical protein
MEKVKIKKVTKAVRRLAHLSGTELVCIGRCDCGDKPQHRNGGRYHPQAWVTYSRDDYAVVLGDTREFFPSDKWGDCPCGVPYRADEEHFHARSPEYVAAAILQHIADAGVITLKRGLDVLETITL